MTNTVYVRKNGPLILRGNIIIKDQQGNIVQQGNEAFLCRCGLSQNKPFCDGAHKNMPFTDAADIHDGEHELPGAKGDESGNFLWSCQGTGTD